MNLTEREQQVVELLRRDPMIGSAAMAERLSMTRAAVNVHLSNLGKKGVILGRGYLLSEQPGVVVIGGANVDLKARSGAKATPGTSNPGHASMSSGGVGRNIAENLARLGTRTHLIAAVGRDPFGDTLLAETAAAGVRLDYVHRTDLPTGTYAAVLDADGELLVAVADMSATDALAPEHLGAGRDVITTAGVVVLDGNLAAPTFAHALGLATAAQVRVVVEPVSVAKAGLLAPHLVAGQVVFAVTPNRDELAALTGLPTRTERQLSAAIGDLHARGVQHVWVRLGEGGSVLASHDGTTTRIAAPTTEVQDVTGAGDAMLAGFCHGLLAGDELAVAARLGQAAATLTVASTHTVRPDLTDRLIRSALTQEHA
ncbi:carbohydrate kinase [Luteipulveratus mongoliensis]|uniref:Carbohydrate kinase n=1 Tax=Luteipulveratus mongoliensis TaxID=571913 RepID=A0A0K1JKC1_9MICO|nr:carbohydrate kinase [Luteipulveratus mongoliensis]AKU17025.1 carbohydrate kinase [Luteipulveratus mongoliensis]